MVVKADVLKLASEAVANYDKAESPSNQQVRAAVVVFTELVQTLSALGGEWKFPRHRAIYYKNAFEDIEYMRNIR